MAITANWSNTIPTDPSAADLLGQDIRDLRKAIQERMDDSYTDTTKGSWANSTAASAVVPKATITGACSDAAHLRHRILHYSKFVPTSTRMFIGGGTSTEIMWEGAGGGNEYAIAVVYQVVGAGVIGGNLILHAPLELGQGSEGTLGKINSFKFICNPLSLGAISLALGYTTYNAGGPATTTIESVASTNTTGIAEFSSTAFDHQIAVDRAYFMKLTMSIAAGGAGRFYSVKVLIQTPDDVRSYLA